MRTVPGLRGRDLDVPCSSAPAQLRAQAEYIVIEAPSTANSADAQSLAVGRDNNGTRTELDGGGHLLETTDGEVDLTPVALLHGQQ